MTTNTAPAFPSFYTECAWLDGHRDAERGTDSSDAYMSHGDPEPIGMAWYRKGFAAQGAGVARHI